MQLLTLYPNFHVQAISIPSPLNSSLQLCYPVCYGISVCNDDTFGQEEFAFARKWLCNCLNIVTPNPTLIVPSQENHNSYRLFHITVDHFIISDKCYIHLPLHIIISLHSISWRYSKKPKISNLRRFYFCTCFAAERFFLYQNTPSGK